MKTVYPVFFTKTDDIILVQVPDLEILTEGNNMSDAIEMARDALELKCVSLEDANATIPQPSSIQRLDVNQCTFASDGQTVISLVDVDSAEYRRKIDTKTVRRNVTLPSWMNYEAEHAGINVPQLLQEALKTALWVNKKL